MRGVRLLLGVMVVGLLMQASGCVSMAKYNEMRAANRMLAAEKEQCASELYDVRNVNDTLLAKLNTHERELTSSDELLSNLRRENNLLHENLKRVAAEHDRLAAQQGLADISIVGPKLPEPLDSALKQFAQKYPDAVAYDPASGSVKWKGDVLFALGSDVVKDTAQTSLKQFGDIFKSAAAEGFEVIVVGHTDNHPISRATTLQKHPTNWHLSAHRAIAVAESLLKGGCEPQRIGVMGCSEYRPVAANDTEENKSLNRRVEIYLVRSGAVVPSHITGLWQVEGEALAFAKLVP